MARAGDVLCSLRRCEKRSRATSTAHCKRRAPNRNPTRKNTLYRVSERARNEWGRRLWHLILVETAKVQDGKSDPTHVTLGSKKKKAFGKALAFPHSEGERKGNSLVAGRTLTGG